MKAGASDPVVAGRIQQAIDSMDAPPAGTLDLPDNMPAAMRRAFEELSRIPTARRTGRIGASTTDTSVLDKKLEILRRIQAGSVAPIEAERLLQNRDLHESADGATQMWAIFERLLSPKIVTGYHVVNGKTEPIQEPNPDWREVRDWIRAPGKG
jgi:hypothetical protein